MSSTKIEFAVQMTCENCVKSVKASLQGVEGIQNVEVNLSNGSVVVDTSLSAERVLERLLSTGKKAVLKGYGTLAGVAILDTGCSNVQGVVRFVQQAPNTCIVDGTVDGLKPGKYQLAVHECGDMSRGCESVGNFFNPNRSSNGRVYGNLGNIDATENGRSVFRFDDNVIKLSDIIGRALVLSDADNRLSCGIIARSAGLFQNPKTICACDGISIWDEVSTPKKNIL